MISVLRSRYRSNIPLYTALIKQLQKPHTHRLSSHHHHYHITKFDISLNFRHFTYITIINKRHSLQQPTHTHTHNKYKNKLTKLQPSYPLYFMVIYATTFNYRKQFLQRFVVYVYVVERVRRHMTVYLYSNIWRATFASKFSISKFVHF